jgi:mannan endo-1,4-beta-mannosidase
MQQWIIEGYTLGGVITIGWHMDNPVSEGSSWDTTRAVYAILPGGEQHEKFVGSLDKFAEFVDGLVVEGEGWFAQPHPVPFLFRPWHEHSGSWFWWGGDNVTPEEYIALWKFTVEYLRDEKGLHNMLYSYATDVFDTDSLYMLHYPGDEWVDMLGYDDYRALRMEETIPDMTRRLKMLVEMAEERGKLSALTETGGGARIPDWWTQRLLKAIEADPVSKRISYALVWRNAGERQNYAPYIGHAGVPDFVKFYENPGVLFLDELPEMYKWKP